MNELDSLQKHNIGKAIGVSVHPKISHSIALAGLAKHYFGGGVPMMLGGLIGYVIGSQTEMLDSDKRQAIQEIMQSAQQLRQQQQNESTEMGGDAGWAGDERAGDERK